MVTLADSLVSSSARKLPVHLRGDLSYKQQRYLGRSYWVIKDPIGLKYYRFQEEEYAILQMIDGHNSLDEIKDQFEAEFPPQKISLEELQSFLGQLHKSGLIVARVPGQGHELHKRRNEKRYQEIKGSMSNILCIRFKGFDPERILKRMYPWFKFLFSKTAFMISLTIMLVALTSIIVNFDHFRSKLPEFNDFFTVENAFLLMICLGVTKVIHEFGHGLTCTHFGGECHEMGVMILVLTPCLYCNVSDSWMLPSKYKRAMIGAAGIYVECLMAAICTFIWWNTQPGLINYLALNVMFLSSVSTILFNANPLLRYDGYYIMSDLVEIPNLRQKATQILTRKLGLWCLGLEPPDDPFLPERNQILFAIYSVAAVMYRWFVLISILFFLYKVFEPIGLKALGQGIAAMSLYGILIMPFWKLYKYMSVPGRLHQVKKVRMFVTLGLIAGLLAIIFLVPLPRSIYAPLEIRSQDAVGVYVPVPGELIEIVKRPGELVEAGDVIARLRSLDLDLAIVQLQGEIEKQKKRIESLERQSYTNSAATMEIPQAREGLIKIEKQLISREADRQRLTLLAPARDLDDSGAKVVIPAPWRKRESEKGDQLGAWASTPLADQNIGALFDTNTVICEIGDPIKMEAELVVDQSDIEFVAINDRVEILLEGMPFDPIEGEVAKINPSNMESVSQRLSGAGGGPVATATDQKTGAEKPLSPSYQVLVYLENNDGLFETGLCGKAKIHVQPQTIAQRAWRIIRETFSFKL